MTDVAAGDKLKEGILSLSKTRKAFEYEATMADSYFLHPLEDNSEC